MLGRRKGDWKEDCVEESKERRNRQSKIPVGGHGKMVHCDSAGVAGTLRFT